MVPGQQPYVWETLPAPFGKLEAIPTSRFAFRSFVRRLLQRFGPGRYKILRQQFEDEKPQWKHVVYFIVRPDGKYRIVKRYTQYRSHPDETQAYWKQHERRILVTVDIKERLRQRQRTLLERLKHEVKKPKPFKYKIEARHWKMEY